MKLIIITWNFRLQNFCCSFAKFVKMKSHIYNSRQSFLEVSSAYTDSPDKFDYSKRYSSKDIARKGAAQKINHIKSLLHRC